ncbi:MAG: HTH-type transcriptional regulator AcrR [Ignavibacteria bacterium ADurb.Bin266]|nr:MAG: HTH-type transcriptional regulator AcrR [Ignavibacteria bacterium ADurb.Bin266]
MNTRKIRYELQRQLILDKSLELFSRKGFAQTSIVDIAKESDISKGHLYHYFSSKDQLFEEILVSSFNSIFKYFNVNDHNIITPGEFEDFILRVFRSLEQNYLNWKLIFQLFTQPEMSERAILLLNKSEPVIKFRNTISAFFEMKNKINPEIRTTYFVSMILGIAVTYLQNPARYPLRQIAEILIEEFIKN